MNSVEYLQKNGITNAYICADPAFMLREDQTSVINNYSEKILGVNLSPLANRYLKIEKDDEEWPEVWSNILENIYKKYNLFYIIIYSLDTYIK